MKRVIVVNGNRTRHVREEKLNASAKPSGPAYLTHASHAKVSYDTFLTFSLLIHLFCSGTSAECSKRQICIFDTFRRFPMQDKQEVLCQRWNIIAKSRIRTGTWKVAAIPRAEKLLQVPVFEPRTFRFINCFAQSHPHYIALKQLFARIRRTSATYIHETSSCHTNNGLTYL